MSFEPDCQHVAMRGVQYGVFGEVQEDREAVAFAAAEHDQVGRLVGRHAQDLGLGMVCTNDVHYLRDSDAHPHDILLCIGTGKGR